MSEILAALLYCNLVTNDQGTYSLRFSSGRFVAGLVRLAAIGAIGFLYNNG